FRWLFCVRCATPGIFTVGIKTFPGSISVSQVFTGHHLTLAYGWLIRRRHRWPPDADVWHLRFHWQQEGPDILSRLNSGHYRLSPMQVIRKASGERVAIWSSRDALVIRMLTLVLES